MARRGTKRLGALEELLLLTLREGGDRHAYGLGVLLQGAGITLTNASARPSLVRMEAEGLVMSLEEGNRRVYLLTDMGERALNAQLAQREELLLLARYYSTRRAETSTAGGTGAVTGALGASRTKAWEE